MPRSWNVISYLSQPQDRYSVTISSVLTQQSPFEEHFNNEKYGQTIKIDTKTGEETKGELEKQEKGEKAEIGLSEIAFQTFHSSSAVNITLSKPSQKFMGP